MIGSWESVFLQPICVPSDYELDVDWPLVFPDLPDDAEEDDGEELLRVAARCLLSWPLVSSGRLSWALRPWVPLR